MERCSIPARPRRVPRRGDEGFYLHLGRLDEEKGIEAVVAAFAGSDRKLVLCGGEGDAGDEVRAQIDRAPNIDYRGFVSQDEKYRLLATCRALVFNGRNEDFGIIPIEANASGKPVLARDEGFPSLFVEDGENGFLHDGTAEGIAYAVDRLEGADLRRNIASRAEQFSRRVQRAVPDPDRRVVPRFPTRS